MKKLVKKIVGKAVSMFKRTVDKVKEAVLQTQVIFCSQRGEGFVDTAIKILMAVVIGALVLGGLYALFGETVLPTLKQRIQDMFNYGG